MNIEVPHRPRAVIGSLALTAAAITTLATGVPVHADDGLLVTTPYPSIETQPGSDVTLDLTVTSAAPEPVDLEVDGLPDGWTSTVRGGGFVIHEITSDADQGSTASLEIDVPPDAEAGDHVVEVVATDGAGGRSVVDVTLRVAETVDNGIALTADFPALSGDPGGTFSYTLSIDNQTPIEQTFTFDPSVPQGWSVTASPTAEAKAQTLTIDAGGSSDLKVVATAPATADEGSYPIDVAVTGANGARGTVTLEADVVGTPDLVLTTADQRLDTKGRANSVERVPLIVSNTGTAVLEGVKLAGTAPSDWDVSFDPKTIDSVKPGESAQVTAVVTPSSDAVAGDYAMTVKASAGSLDSTVDLRYTLEGSRTLGIVAIGVIAAAAAVLIGVFVKFGRR